MNFVNAILGALFNARLSFDSRSMFLGGRNVWFWRVRLDGTVKPWRRGMYSRGAGYINGFTAFIGRNVRNAKDASIALGRAAEGVDLYCDTAFAAGVTRNGNAVPYVGH